MNLKVVALAVMLILALLAAYQFSTDHNSNVVSYKVEKCEAGFGKPFARYDEQNKTLNAVVWVNCCGVEVKVEREGKNLQNVAKKAPLFRAGMN
ncbi:hypothetical protein [Archaeoglobus profundus]|uniref:Uncharacterized protein n=1 Tax=Archaeoglobus profundus (strain DSM 5631 / JCM 9629 / NBRC 100127 / Av18) TaxID=572546 RepID=D2RGR5_ARCPA|nr:hypothetical protein [Archaeoglobus profundus]ADB57490.1 hypothetical protein Arcpr_0422 [Archaeoglobus profundus DSM 5631]